MITIYKYVPAWGLPDMSPFAVKLELYLRMTGAKFETAVGDPRRAPKGKLPYIIDHDNGNKLVTDTVHILEYLKRQYGDPLDAHLNPEQRAISEAFRGLIEQHFYFVLAYLRWWNDEDFSSYRVCIENFARKLSVPGFAIPLATWKARRDIRNQLWQQGIARHSKAEVEEIGIKCLQAVENYIGAKKYVFGENQASIDASVYAFVTGVGQAPMNNSVKEFIQKSATLSAYCARIEKRYWHSASV